MKDAFSHFPGVNVQRQFEGYTPYQEKLWQAWDDTYHARAFGFEHTRKPSPGAVYNEVHFKAWRNKMLNQLKIEATRDHGTRGFDKDDLSESAMLYLYECMVDASKYKDVRVWTDD